MPDSPPCPHPNLVVDYAHPYSLLPDTPVAALQASDPASTRPTMTLTHPRCQTCGRSLRRADLGARIGPGGDAWDPRFRWAFPR